MIPINIAITGHRDLLQSQKTIYKNKIKAILLKLKKHYPHSEIQVMSGMAEGADIIAARATLETGCSLIAMLPMPKDDFVKTFETENRAKNIKEFTEVLSKAKKIIDLSKVYPDRKSKEDSFVQLGVYLNENAQMIIALWDGVYTDSPGGTASVIKSALDGMPRNYRKKFNIIDSDDTIPVRCIKVKRTKPVNGHRPEYVQKDMSEYKTLYPSVWEYSDIEQVENYYDCQLYEIDHFNRNYAKYAQGKSHLKGADDDSIKSIMGMESIINVQKAADQMANTWQKRTVALIISQLLFGFFVFFWVVLFDEILPFAPGILLLSPLFFLLCVVTFNYARKKNIEERYYEYRALAECLRVQFYWKSAGLRENVYNNYTRKDKYELGWVVAAARNISIDINYEQCKQVDYVPDYDKLRENWILDQLKYFVRKNKENRFLIKKNKQKMYTLFGAGLVFVLLLIIERLYVRTLFDSEFIMHILLFLIDASLAGGAIFSSYLDKRQFESELKQFARMKIIFSQGIKEFDEIAKTGNMEETKKIIVELGADALAENADWVVYNRMNSIDIPMG